LILDFGDSFTIHETIKASPIYEVIQKSFPKLCNEVLALSYQKICNPSAMSLAKNFYSGNYVNQLFKNLNISSQKISEILKTIGNKKTLRNFFASYIETVQDRENGLIIDSTALPNQIHIPFTSWGYSDSNIDISIKFLFVTIKESGSPLYFRYLPGSIPDVSLVTNTLEELKEYGFISSMALLDLRILFTRKYY
jgi:transposase